MDVTRRGIPTRSTARRPQAGFTIVELLVVIAIIALLAGIILASLSRARKSAKSLDCVSRLRQIGLAFTYYAADNHRRLPDPIASDMSWEQSLLRYLGN